MGPNFQPSPPQDKPQEETLVTDRPQENQYQPPVEAAAQPDFNEDTFDQPEPSVREPGETPNYTPAPSVPDAFGPAPHDTPAPQGADASSPAPAAFPFGQITTEPVTAQPETPVTAPQPQKKKSRLGLWVALGAVFLILLGLLIGYFVVKSGADASAKTYTANEKTYIDSVYDAATSPAAAPSDILKDVEGIKPPVLGTAVLSDVSSDYSSAKKLQTEATAKVTDLTTKLKDYAQVDEFYTKYQTIYTDLQALDDQGTAAVATRSKALVTNYLEQFLDKLKEVNDLVASTTVPSELNSDLEELGRVHSSMSLNWEAMVSAFNSGNSTAYDAAYAKYVTATKQLSAAKAPFTTYFNSLSSKSRDAAKDLKTYRDTLK